MARGAARLAVARLLVPCGLAQLARAAQTTWGPVPWTLQLSGACSYQCQLNGLIYDYQGRTANGSPYYKGRNRDEYIYYDPDCTGGGDGTPRWIMDNDKPLPSRWIDLDNDGACDYHARTNNFVGSHVPIYATWKMRCDEGWVDRFITFLEITSTSTTSTTSGTSTSTQTSTTTSRTATTTTRTTTTRTTTTRTATTRTATTTSTATTTTRTSRTATSTTVTTTARTHPPTTRTHPPTATTTTSEGTAVDPDTDTTTVPPCHVTTQVEKANATETTTTTTTFLETLVLGGACSFKTFLNGLRFVFQGHTANGAPYYKYTAGHLRGKLSAADRDQYIYFDNDCDGGSERTPRWILDEDVPNIAREQDLDEDKACNYHASLDMDYRGGGMGPPASGEWRMYCGEGWESVELTLTREQGKRAGLRHAAVLYLDGACPEKGYLNGLAFHKEGLTVLGAPYYRSLAMEQYIYFDPNCDGDAAEPMPRWIIDSSAPNPSAQVDLDHDGKCDYHARAHSTDPSAPPADALWRMYCGGRWTDVRLHLSANAPSTSTTATTTHPELKVISAASGAAAPGLLLLALALALPAVLAEQR